MVVRHVGFAVKSVIGNSGDSAEKARLCAYCKETGSSCCHRPFVRLQCGESESRGSSLKGLTIAMALLLSAVCLAVVWCFYRWYYMRNGNSKQAAKPKYAWTQSSGPPNSANSGLDGCSADLVTESANTAFVLAENIGTCQDSKNICSASAKSTHPEQTRHPLMFVSKISRLFCRIRHTRASQESTQAVSTITLSPPRSPTTELQQPGPPDTNALGLTIAKRGQSLRGLNPRECDSPSSNESSSLQPHPTISETNFYDVPEQHIADSDSTNSVGDSDIFEVLYPYSPVESDELAITPGEKIRVLRVFSDGWAFVQRVDDGKIGAIPAVCLDSTLR
ncbi:hypothetical protein H4S00_000156 [Coemansia sp. D1744]|nr:hypothetical protein H4S00_000156 [Coemansia sp. D1744]